MGRSFVGLLSRKPDDLRERYGIEYRMTGIATRRLGWLVAPEGFAADKVLQGDFSQAQKADDLNAWIAAAKPTRCSKPAR